MSQVSCSCSCRTPHHIISAAHTQQQVDQQVMSYLQKVSQTRVSHKCKADQILFKGLCIIKNVASNIFDCKYVVSIFCKATLHNIVTKQFKEEMLPDQV